MVCPIALGSSSTPAAAGAANTRRFLIHCLGRASASRARGRDRGIVAAYVGWSGRPGRLEVLDGRALDAVAGVEDVRRAAGDHVEVEVVVVDQDHDGVGPSDLGLGQLDVLGAAGGMAP